MRAYGLSGLPQERGFTLVEMITVIVLTGILGGMVALFIASPMQGYVDSARRAEMTDIADTALRRIARDLRLALPNSVRVTLNGGSYYLEFIPTKAGGRYRVASPGNILDFSSASDSSFDVLGPAVAATASDYLVIYNLGVPSATGCATSPGADAYEGCNRRPIVSGGTTLTFTAASYPLPFDSPGHRFQVASAPVTYVCAPAMTGASGSGTLTRYWGYAFSATQPTSLATLSAVNAPAVLANYVSGCSISYSAYPQAQHAGLVTLSLSITESGESVNLYNAAHVNNVP